MARGFPGQITNTSDAFSTESMTLEKSDAPFGVVLVSDNDGFCRLPDKSDALGGGASTGVAVGILIQQKNNEFPCTAPLVLPIGNGEQHYAKEKQIVGLMRVGTIFVKVETDVKRNDAVYYRVVKTDTTSLGSLRNDADTNKAVKLNGAVFANSASAGETVEVSMNLNTVQEAY